MSSAIDGSIAGCEARFLTRDGADASGLASLFAYSRGMS